jgi:hypothetical protein
MTFCIGHSGGDYGTSSNVYFDAKASIEMMLFTNYSEEYLRGDVPAARAFNAAWQALLDYARQNAGTN